MSLKNAEILAQNPGVRPPRRRAVWLPALAILPLFGVVAAFGFAPEKPPEPVEIQHVVENIALPAPVASPDQGRQSYWREERIQRGDTVATILSRLGVDDAAAMNYLLQARDVRSLYRLIPGRSVRAVTTGDGRLEELIRHTRSLCLASKSYTKYRFGQA